jgi:acyl phosphate:glycerol-3-phosphate acyltransferase
VGPLAGALTLLMDAAKGAVAVWLAARFSDHAAMAMMFAGIAALLGHCFPVWLKFRGGKGVATALGVYLALCPLAAIVAVVLFTLVVAFWRYVSLGSLSAAAAMPLLTYFLWAPGHAPPLVITLGTLFAAVLIFYKHDANLQRLVDGTEPKYSLGRSKGERKV